EKARRVDRRRGQPRVQPGLAHRARPAEPSDLRRGHHALRDRAQGEPRRSLPRRLSRQRRGARQVQPGVQERPRRAHADSARAHSRDGGLVEADHRGEQVMPSATFRIWRGDAKGGGLKDYSTEVSEGMVVLDAVHQIQAEQAYDLACRWNCKAGKCGSCSAEVNGNPRLMCMTRLNQLDLSKPVTVEPMRAFPPIRDLVTDVSWNFRAR